MHPAQIGPQGRSRLPIPTFTRSLYSGTVYEEVEVLRKRPTTGQTVPKTQAGQVPGDSLCIYAECYFCKHRVNASRTANGEGQCDLELRGSAKRTFCKGKLLLAIPPDRQAKYRAWILGSKSSSL